MSEVEEILARLEQDEVDVDQLSEQVGRAVELIQLCRQKLEKTDGEVRKLVSGLQDGGPAAREAEPRAGSRND